MKILDIINERYSDIDSLSVAKIAKMMQSANLKNKLKNVVASIEDPGQKDVKAKKLLKTQQSQLDAVAKSGLDA